MKKKIYLITNLELDATYDSILEVDNLDDKDYKEYVAKNGNVYTLEEFIRTIFSYGFVIPYDDNERSESISYRIFKEE